MSHPSSGVPLFGLIDGYSIKRRVAADDGAGGISDQGTPITVFASIQARVTTLDPDKDQLRDYGFSAAKNRKVLLPYSPSIKRTDIFVAPFGLKPNLATPIGLAPGMCSKIDATRLDGSNLEVLTQLVWNDSTQSFTNGGDQAIAYDSGDGRWELADTANGDSFNWPTYIAQGHNFMYYPETLTSGLGAVYSLTCADSDKEYRIVWVDHKQDDLNGMHHTSLVIELEDEDT